MKIHGLTPWIDKLVGVDMPGLSLSVANLSRLTEDDDSAASHLAEEILKDANLTAQVLKVANSAVFTTGASITTVSRAVVLIGFDGVKAICISVMLVETLLKNEPRERLLKAMANAFHRAVQARNVAYEAGEDNPEEAFVAALLFTVGEMAFWAYGGDVADALDAAWRNGGDERQAVKDTVGTSFERLSKGLAKAWNLGGVLEVVFQHSEEKSKVVGSKTASAINIEAVLIGEDINQAVSAGWRSKSMKSAERAVAGFTQLEQHEVREMIREGVDEASEMAKSYGANKVVPHIPGKQGRNIPVSTMRVMKGDLQLQVNILQELATAMSENLEVNTIFQMVMEGLHRGVGLERVAVAFITKDQLRLKYMLGESTKEWRNVFQYSLDEPEKNIFTFALEGGVPVCMNISSNAALAPLYTRSVVEVLGRYNALLAPVILNGRNVALFYADRGDTGEEFEAEQFSQFSHFVSQAQLALEVLASKR